MKKTIILLVVFTSTFMFSQTEKIDNEKNQGKIILYEGTPIKATLKKDLKGGKVQVGERVEFTLEQPIVVDDKVIVNSGAKILGSITEARSSGVIGRKGKLALDIEYLYLDNGQIVKLTGQYAKNLKSRGAVSVATAVVLTPLGLLIPGKGAKFKEGTIFDAYIAKDTEIK